MDDGFGFQAQSQIFITDGGEGRYVALIAEHGGDLRRVVDGSVGSIQDGVTLAQMKGSFVALRGAHGDMVQGLKPGLVEGESCGEVVETQSHKSKATAEGGQGLAENGILLSLQLRQQTGKGGTAGLVDSTGR